MVVLMFKINQRVRIVEPKKGDIDPNYVGLVGIITGIDDQSQKDPLYKVKYDKPPNWSDSHYWEPIYLRPIMQVFKIV